MMVFPLSHRGNKYRQVSKTFLSILANLNDSVFWKVSTHPPISNSTSHVTKPLEIVPNTTITSGIIVNLLLLLFTFWEFLSFWMMAFHWSLRDNKSPQVSWNLLRILADLNNAVVHRVSTHPLIFKSSSPFINPSVTVPITIGINVTFMFHSFSIRYQR